MSFIHDDFLLQSEGARDLYHQHAKNQPIIDYHSHLPPEDVASDRRFDNLYEIWLEGDHYKWRAMRAAGLPEDLCSGDADPYDKYLAWARTVPQTLRNPLYHWTHLELKRYFGIDKLLSEDTAREIWDEANEQLASPEFSARNILQRFKVQVVCTTDDPGDDLIHHQKIAREEVATRIYPTFRPDKAFAVRDVVGFNGWCDTLAGITNISVYSLEGLLAALGARHDFFHNLGGRLSDHGMTNCLANFCDFETADDIFVRARAGETVSEEEEDQLASFIFLETGRLDAQKGWTKQIHLGPLRNNNTLLFQQGGRDIGCDSMNDGRQVENLGRFLDALAQEGSLPKMVVYNMNPKDSMALATMIGNFQDPGIPGKMQYGSGWWYLDTKSGMEQQMEILSSVGLFSRFVGMLTDSRSFLSFTRHEYFRRILCNLVGRDIENGELPDDKALLGSLIENICYRNAREYFGFELS